MRKTEKTIKKENKEFWQMIQELGEQAQIIINQREHEMLFEYWSAEVRAEEAEAKAAEEAKTKTAGKKANVVTVPTKTKEEELVRESSNIPSRIKHAEKVKEEYLCQLDPNAEAEAHRKIGLIFQNRLFKQKNDDGDIDTVAKFYEEIRIPAWRISRAKKRIMPGLSAKRFKVLCETARSNAKGLARYAKRCAKKAEAPCPLREACIQAYAKSIGIF